MEKAYRHKLITNPLSRLRFVVYLVVAVLLYTAITLMLGLNFGLKNSLFAFLPVTLVFVLICFSLFARRFSDAGFPGLLCGAATMLLVASLLIGGMTGLGLLALALLFVVAWVIPSTGVS